MDSTGDLVERADELKAYSNLDLPCQVEGPDIDLIWTLNGPKTRPPSSLDFRADRPFRPKPACQSPWVWLPWYRLDHISLNIERGPLRRQRSLAYTMIYDGGILWEQLALSAHMTRRMPALFSLIVISVGCFCQERIRQQTAKHGSFVAVSR